MKKDKEVRIYVIDMGNSEFEFRAREEEKDFNAIMDEAERLGSVYSLKGFQEAINNQDLELGNAFIYISNIPKS